MNNDVMKIIAEQIGALVITNANMAAKIAALEAELAAAKVALSQSSNSGDK